MSECKCKCKGATSSKGSKGDPGATGANGTNGVNAQQGYSYSWSRSNTEPFVHNDGSSQSQGELASLIYRGTTYHGGITPATIDFIAAREVNNESIVTLVLTDITNNVVIGTKVITSTVAGIVTMNITGAVNAAKAYWKLTCYSSTAANKCYLYAMDIKF